MEVLEVDEAKKPEVHMTSAAAFVEGGIQESCDDACSICLEDFCESDPSTVTNCKHEFHLQCILEWCQRSSECPMCLRSISLKDPTSQELFEAVERERKIRAVPSRNATIFHHPTLGDFELQHLPVGVSDSELEERIIQHLAAAAIGRTHHLGRREGQRNRSSPHGRPRFLVFSTHPGAQPSGHDSSSLSQLGRENELAGGSVASPSTPLTSVEDEPSQQALQLPSILSDQRSFNNRSTSSQSALPNPDRAGPSEFQSCPNSLKSRLNAVSMRYKESISRSTRAWKERLFSRNSSMSDIGSEVQREVNAGIATVSRLMDRLETRDNSGANQVSVSTHRTDRSVAERSNQNNAETHTESPVIEGSSPVSCAASFQAVNSFYSKYDMPRRR
uniref:RING-type E3 ubiquitin transferase n=1 Tax=Salix viminalis TaxID=40686 RepID=A0A6N2MSJ4_SALVM